MSGRVAITSQIMAAKTRPTGTIQSLFMTTSCDSVLAHQGAVGSPNLLGLRRPDLVVPRRRRAPRWQPHLATCSAFRPCWGAEPGLFGAACHPARTVGIPRLSGSCLVGPVTPQE